MRPVLVEPRGAELQALVLMSGSNSAFKTREKISAEQKQRPACPALLDLSRLGGAGDKVLH